MRQLIPCGFAVVLLFAVASTLDAAKRTDKTIRVVGKRHGPWMIQVVAMKSRTAKQRTANAQRGAELVSELRNRGIPAYLIVRTISVEQPGPKKGDKPVITKYAETVVLAGNYSSDKTEVARKTLVYLRQVGDSAFVKKSKRLREIRGSFRNAFLCPNPLL